MVFRIVLALADDLNDLIAHALEGNVRHFQGFRGYAFALANQPQQDMFGADIVMLQAARLILRQHHYPARPICKAFEHFTP
ncbi:MAG: hypothetical protein E7K48_00420 [Varibaculum cambriense]|nr:hypothetical protein [Varibaculum cambriense]